MISSCSTSLYVGAGGTPTLSQMILFDGGFANKEEAESFGIRPEMLLLAILTANGKMLLKSWDNCYGSHGQ